MSSLNVESFSMDAGRTHFIVTYFELNILIIGAPAKFNGEGHNIFQQ